MKKIQIIYGSTRDSRGGNNVLNWISDLASKRNDMQSEVVDLRNYPLPFFNESISPSMNNGNYSLKRSFYLGQESG